MEKAHESALAHLKKNIEKKKIKLKKLAGQKDSDYPAIMIAPDLKTLVFPAYQKWKIYIREMGEEDIIESIEFSIRTSNFLDHGKFLVLPGFPWCDYAG